MILFTFYSNWPCISLHVGWNHTDIQTIMRLPASIFIFQCRPVQIGLAHASLVSVTFSGKKGDKYMWASVGNLHGKVVILSYYASRAAAELGFFCHTEGVATSSSCRNGAPTLHKIRGFYFWVYPATGWQPDNSPSELTSGLTQLPFYECRWEHIEHLNESFELEWCGCKLCTR